MNVVRSRRALMAFLLALALPFALVACGDDSGDDTEAAQQDETPDEEITPEAEETTEGETGGQQIHVVAKDFMFEGLPETLPAGEVTMHFVNEGKEEHELALMLKKTDATIEELLSMPEKEAMKQVEFVGGTFAKPGETAKKPLVAELQPGNYAAVCFVPNKKGPHALQGMVHELVVE